MAGVLLAATLGGYNPNTSGNYLLPAFAAVFLVAYLVRRRSDPVRRLVFAFLSA